MHETQLIDQVVSRVMTKHSEMRRVVKGEWRPLCRRHQPHACASGAHLEKLSSIHSAFRISLESRGQLAARASIESTAGTISRVITTD